MLDSLPAPESFTFCRTQKSGHGALKLFLGTRPNSNGSSCQMWTRIVSAERKNLKPPVVFYDQELSANGSRSLQYPRSASSFLRKATDLRPPFCFLQHDPFDQATGMRDMLCALILYQALVTGVDACALQWAGFGDGLSQALRYIDLHGAYHQWRHGQNIASTQSGLQGSKGSSDTFHTSSPTANDLLTANTMDKDEYTGGMVRPSGDVVIKPRTSLARLRNQLGHTKCRLLANIPAIPMRVSRHDLDPPYFRFRLQIGTVYYPEADHTSEVHAYLVHDGVKKTVLKVLSYDAKGRQESWRVEGLQGIKLFEPFDYLNKLKTKSNGTQPGQSARAAKIRSVISYYFFLAENDGLLDDPRITIGEAFGKRLCAACAELQEADFGEHDYSSDAEHLGSHDDNTDIDVPLHEPMKHVQRTDSSVLGLTCEERGSDKPSYTITLGLPSRAPLDIVSYGPLKYRGEIAKGDTRGDQPRPSSKLVPSRALDSDSLAPRLKTNLSPRLAPEPSDHVLSEDSVRSQDRSSTDVCAVELPRLVPVCGERQGSDEAIAGPDVIRIVEELANVAPTIDAVATRGKIATRLDGLRVENNADLPPLQETFAEHKEVTSTRKTIPELSTVERDQNQRIRSLQNNSDSDSDSVSMDVSSSSSPAQNRFLNSETHTDETSAILMSVSRGLGARSAVADKPNLLLKSFEIVELSSDDEADKIATRNDVDQTPEFSYRHRTEVDLTQLSPSPQGEKRKAVLIIDSDDDLVEEVGDGGWQRASRRRQ